MERYTQEINICLGHAHFLSLNSDNVFEDHPHYEFERLMVNADYYSGVDLEWTHEQPESSELSDLEYKYAMISKDIKKLKEIIIDETVDGNDYLKLKADFDQQLINISLIEQQIITLRES